MKYGRYEVVSEIGRGSMGVVYQAHDPQIGRQVALKVLREDRLSSEDYIKRFLNEATAVGRLSHRSIVTVYDIGQDHGTIYIAMELLEGTPLDELSKQQILTLEEILKIGRDVSEALHYAHKKGIVHRDIKPANIVCLENGDIKVTDFGIAHIEDLDGQQLTQAGEILGTPVYMSPEQVLGQPVDGRSDIYSLGVILYEQAAGRRPFQGKNIGALFNAITNDEVVSPERINANIPAWFAKIIMKALAREPARRYVSGEEVIQDINKAVLAAGTQRDKAVPRKKKSLIAFLAVLLVVSGAGVFYFAGVYKKETSTLSTAPSVSTSVKPEAAAMSTEDAQPPREAIDTDPDSVAEPGEPKSARKEADPDQNPLLEEMAGDDDTFNAGQQDSVAERKSSKDVRLSVKKREGNVSTTVVEPANKAVASAVLKMQTNPQGAEVYVDGAYVGKTPSDFSVTAEKHEVMVKLAGYGDWKAQLDLRKGGKVPISIRLLSK